MKVVFFGTPAFAVPSLDAVLAESEIAAVVTQPDRPRGRGLAVEHTPVAAAAHQYALDVRQPESLRDPVFIDALRALAPDLLVVVAYGRFLPARLLAMPRLGGINLHPSLLPRYRGAAPIPRAIEAGDRETGVTVLYLSDEMDAGRSHSAASGADRPRRHDADAGAAPRARRRAACWPRPCACSTPDGPRGAPKTPRWRRSRRS